MKLFTVQNAINSDDIVWPLRMIDGLGSEFDIQLTPNFRVSEFVVSEEHPDLAALIQVWPSHLWRLWSACNHMFQPLRNRMGPVIVTSGIRSTELNSAVNGHVMSHHLFKDLEGAADITVPGADPVDVGTRLLLNGNPERVIEYGRQNFCHVSFPNGNGKYIRQLLHR